MHMVTNSLWLSKVTVPSCSTSPTSLMTYIPGGRLFTNTVAIVDWGFLEIVIVLQNSPSSILQTVSIQLWACDPSANVQLNSSPSAT